MQEEAQNTLDFTGINATAHTVRYFNGQPVDLHIIDGKPWFVARHVCDCLGLEHITRALNGIDGDDLTVRKLQSGGQMRDLNPPPIKRKPNT